MLCSTIKVRHCIFCSILHDFCIFFYSTVPLRTPA